MYLNNQKLITFYNQCLIARKLKNNHLQHLVGFVVPNPLQHPIVNKSFNIYAIKNIVGCTQKIFLDFETQLNTLKSLISPSDCQPIHSMKEKIKNFSENQSRQDSLLQELLIMVDREREKGEDPIIYYDMKYRQTTITTIQNKINQIHNYQQNLQEVTQPLYPHKFERQTKSNLLIVNSHQLNYNRTLNTKLMLINQHMNNIILSISETIRNLSIDSHISEIKSEFLENNQYVLRKRGKLSQNELLRYLKSVGLGIKNNKEIYNEYKLNLEYIRNYLKLIMQHSNNKYQQFQKKQRSYYEDISAISEDVSIIMNFSIVFMIRDIIARFFQLKDLLKEFINLIEMVIKEIKQNQQIIDSQLRKINQSGINMKPDDLLQNFKHFKLFFQNQQKTQRNILSFILKNFSKFLLDFRFLFSHHMKDYHTGVTFQLQDKNINKIINHLFMVQSSSLSGSQQITKTSSISQPDNQIVEAALKLIEGLKINEIKDLTNSPNFSCALGPRLLLHGKLYAHYEGIYFDSWFNKKNLFFGKTKLFIPRKQICGFGCGNVFGFIPDVFEVQTKKGVLIFHSLGWRNHAIEVLNQCYFPEISAEDQQTILDDQFHHGSVPQCLNMPFTQPLKQILLTYNYSIELRKYFRRYISQDKFDFQGKQYQNFKTFFLTELGCIQPKSTEITPQPPFYFQYKKTPFNQNIPQKSQRLTRYRKIIQRIPFLAAGGQYLCQQREVFYWISPTSLVGETRTQVMGFSLIEGMEVLIRTFYQQKDNNLKITISCDVTFATESFSNKLLSSSAIGNVKETCIKQHQVIQRYQKIKKKKIKKSKSEINTFDIDEMKNINLTLETQNYKLKKKIFLLSILLAIITLILLLMIATLIQY